MEKRQMYMIGAVAAGAGLLFYFMKKGSTTTTATGAGLATSLGTTAGAASSDWNLPSTVNVVLGTKPIAVADPAAVSPAPAPAPAPSSPAATSSGFVIGGGANTAPKQVYNHFYTLDVGDGKPTQQFVSDAASVSRLDSIQAYVSKTFDGSAASLQNIADTAHQYGVSEKDIAAAMGYYAGDIHAVFEKAGVKV